MTIQIADATPVSPYICGKIAFHQDINAPAQDKYFLDTYIFPNPLVDDQEQHAFRVQAYRDWMRGWTMANLAAPLPELDD